MLSHLSIARLLILGAVLLGIPGAVWLETTNPQLFSERLSIPNLEFEPHRHTPLVTTGIYAPPRLTASVTITPESGPLIVTQPTRIESGVTLTLMPGAAVFFSEFASLRVHGNLEALGTAEHPVLFSSNETHPDNRWWGGLIVDDHGTAHLDHVVIERAAPGISCLNGAQVQLSNSNLRQGLVGVYAETSACLVYSSSIDSIRSSIIERGVTLSPTDTTLSARQAVIQSVTQ